MNKLTLLITPTQEDVDNGVARVCSKCPIAKAINRALRPLMFLNVKGVAVDTVFFSNVVESYTSIHSTMFLMTVGRSIIPGPIGNWIRQFDDFLRVFPMPVPAPFEITIEWWRLEKVNIPGVTI